MKKAVLLLSGGMDSTTVFAIMKEEGYDVYALSFDYGQRNKVELNSAKKIVKYFGAKEHKIAFIDLRIFGKSALTDDIEVPKGQSGAGAPVTYVPARNTIFLSFALAYAETISAYDIFIGANIVDYSGYPDCRPEYINAFENMANLATVAGANGKFKIHAPLIKMTKSEIIKKGMSLGVDYSMTISCYNPDAGGNPCNECAACCIRNKGIEEACR